MILRQSKNEGRINEIGRRFKVDARIHKLGITLKRKAEDETAGAFEEADLAPLSLLKIQEFPFEYTRDPT